MLNLHRPLVPCLLVTVLVLSLLAGCPKPPTAAPPVPTPGATAAAPPTGEPLKIGAIFSLQGAGAPLGTPERDTLLLLEKSVNAAGGINGRPLKIVIQDDQSEEAVALTAAKQLIENEKVLAVIGPTISGTSLAILPTFEKAEVPLVSCAASVKITQPVKKWVFSTAQPDTLAVAKLMDYLKAKGLKQLALLTDSNAFGASGLQVLKTQAAENGMTVVAAETFGSKDSSMTTQLTRIKGKSPQAIICWGTNPGPAVVARNAQDLKLKIPLFMSHGVSNHKFVELAGAAAEGIIFPSSRILVAEALAANDPQKQTLLDYTKAFTAEYQQPPNSFGGHAWDALQIVVAALRSAGDDRAKLRDAIEKTTDFIGISGVFKMSPTDHNGLTKDAFVLVTVKGGKWEIVK
ncbi:MAG TPA: ABC transporter substrate-binding protein [Armatimonadota bacterium]|jgi:branched-chain amino acid transport system substrate-binding protein